MIADTQQHADEAAALVVVTYSNIQTPILSIDDWGRREREREEREGGRKEDVEGEYRGREREREGEGEGEGED